MVLHSIIFFMLFLCWILTTTIAIREINHTDEYICITSDTRLENIQENVRVKNPDPRTDDPIIVFDGNTLKKTKIYGLIPSCKMVQKFHVMANYDPEMLPNQAGEVETKIEGTDQIVKVTSCHQLFKNAVNAEGCKAEDHETLSCKKEANGLDLLNCTTTFGLNCNMTKYAYEINNRPGMSVLIDGEIYVHGLTPCNFKFETTYGFRLLIPNKSKNRANNDYKSIGACFKSMKRTVERLCGVQTTATTNSPQITTPKGTKATMTVGTEAPITHSPGTTTIDGTETSSSKSKKKTISECILTIPYLLLICGAILQVIIIIVLIILLVVCKRRNAVEANRKTKDSSGVVGEEQLYAEKDNVNDRQQLNNDNSWQKEKSEWMGVQEPNVRDGTIYDSADYEMVSDDMVSGLYGYNKVDVGGVDVPPTKEDDFDEYEQE